MNIQVVSPRINKQICKSVPKFTMLNYSLESNGLFSRLTCSLRESFKFLCAFSLMMGCQK